MPFEPTEVTADFWVGGHYENTEWTWLDGSPMEHGSPFWTVRWVIPIHNVEYLKWVQKKRKKNYQQMCMNTHVSMNTTTFWKKTTTTYSYLWIYRYSDLCKYREVTTALNITRRANSGSCYRYYQAPNEFPQGECVALTFQHFYYMSDEDCLHRKSPLCVATDRN